MKKNFLSLLIICCSLALYSQVEVVKDNDGHKLLVNDQPFMVNGMNWDYFPIGTNYSYSLWNQSDELIQNALDAEMGLLKNMGVNSIRVYTGIQPKWIQYIYENYGIHTMLNHSFGRYGLTIDGAWVAVTDYSDPRTQQLLLSEVKQMAADYNGTPGLLLYLLGNENNYGLFWAGAETEDFPDEDEERNFIGESRGRPMYSLMNEAAIAIKNIDNTHPVAICNGDVLFMDIIAEECTDVDIFGTNTYRGLSFTSMFDEVAEKLDMPILLTEFGSDAFNAVSMQEDQEAQARYMLSNWKEIYENAAGMGKANNSIGGYTFQFSDGWWKFGQTENLDTHDTNASWANGGYQYDFREGKNNMNEEWFGITAKGPTNPNGTYTLYPRAAYYVLQNAHNYNPYASDAAPGNLTGYFSTINVTDAMLRARGDKAILKGSENSKVRLSSLRAVLETYNTGGSLITTPDNASGDNDTYPNELGFDHLQSFFVGVAADPLPNMHAEVNFNILGNVAQNPINEIFYENRGRPFNIETPDGQATITDNERFKLYNIDFEWDTEIANIHGFHRTGHYHWGYEGDFFGLYPEANYGPNLDIYGGEFTGFEIEGKGALNGFDAAVGPQLWWGANPTFLAKYGKKIADFDVTGIYHRDFDTNLDFDDSGRRQLDQNQISSGVIPPWPSERATIAIEREFNRFGVALGGIWSGSPLNGSSFQDVRTNNGEYVVYQDKINADDNWGGKVKLTYDGGRFKWYGQASAMGIVANGGFDQTLTYTGWRLKDSGSGNMTNILSGFTYQAGDFQIAPNFLWQQPIVDPIPNDINGPGRLRNIIDDPFSVRGGNRETVAGELLLTYDPTPGSYYYQWDNDRAEDAKFAMNLGVVYWHLPTTQDAHIGFNANRTFFPFPSSAPADDLWEVNSRIVSKVNPELGFIANLFTGTGQAQGDSERTIDRTGADIRVLYKKFKMTNMVRVNDWGPYDYHRDFNLTYPLQLMTDIGASVGKPDWFLLPNTQVGVRGTWRALDEFSPRYSPNQVPPNTFPPVPTLSPTGFGNGSEWEIRTYLHINIGN